MWRKWSTSIPAPDRVPAEIDARLAHQAAGRMTAWATCLPDGTPVGMTTYLNIDEANRRLEIGYTWLGASAQRTMVNPEAKLLQLTRAFDDLDCIAVEFRTHWHNRQSRRAIAALGAKQDGVLRNHQFGKDGPCATRSCSPSSARSGRPCAPACAPASAADGGAR